MVKPSVCMRMQGRTFAVSKSLWLSTDCIVISDITNRKIWWGKIGLYPYLAKGEIDLLLNNVAHISDSVRVVVAYDLNLIIS